MSVPATTPVTELELSAALLAPETAPDTVKMCRRTIRVLRSIKLRSKRQQRDRKAMIQRLQCLLAAAKGVVQ